MSLSDNFSMRLDDSLPVKAIFKWRKRSNPNISLGRRELLNFLHKKKNFKKPYFLSLLSTKFKKMTRKNEKALLQNSTINRKNLIGLFRHSNSSVEGTISSDLLLLD